MSIQLNVITHTCFSLSSLQSEAYELTVNFLNENSEILSKKIITFEKTHPVDAGVILDVYSQNGVCPERVSDLFTKKKGSLFSSKDRKEISKAAEKMVSLEISHPSLIVLDIKDPSKSYLNKNSIQEAEEAFCQFKKEKMGSEFTTLAQSVHKMFQEKLNFDFVFKESSLKCDLVQDLSEMEAGFFLKPGKGGLSFCQYTEFFINSFKLGQSTKGLNSSEYYSSVSEKYTHFEPKNQTLIWYPESYKHTYAKESDFVKTLDPVFQIEGEFEATSGITVMSMGLKS